MIQNIPIEKIHSHPLNPRKDLGDLTELVASIKANGILQNLTLVHHPDLPEDEFYAVIGNRRHAASKLAGLSELPAAISDMDEKTQVSTMLLENMQRNDLTVWEEAQGFQMMLDMGETEADIAKKTGFTKTTIRKRINLLSLDPDKFKESVARGARLEDFARLEKIEDPTVKNRVLDKIGTADFENTLKKAIDDEKWQKEKAAILETLASFATLLDDKNYDRSKYRAVTYYGRYSKTKAEVPDDANEKEYFYYMDSWNISLLVEQTDDPAAPAAETPEQRKYRLARERRQELDEVARRAFELRSDFIANLHVTKKLSKNIMEFAVRMLLDDWHDFDGDYIINTLGIDLEVGDEWEFETIEDVFNASPERVLLVTVYSCMDTERNNYHRWDNTHDENPQLDELYRFLEKLGYQMSEEERQLQDGTHELFGPIDDEPEDPCSTCKAAHPSCDGCCAECEDTCNSCQMCHKQSSNS